MLDTRCKKCRYYGEKLFLKGEKCFTPKCPLVRRGVKRRRQTGGYQKQLEEKQKVKLIYGLREKQLKRYFQYAFQAGTSTPVALGQMLELRLDNVVFRLGFAPTRTIARQLVTHGHFYLNNKPHNIPSTILKIGDKISLRPQSKKKKIFLDLEERLKKIQLPSFLRLDKTNLIGEVVSVPDLEAMRLPFDLASIVEFYSK